MNPNLHIEPSPELLIEGAASQIAQLAAESISARGQFSFALAGGSTPRKLYERLASDDWRDKIDWTQTHIFFGDERAVSPDDERSNFRMANESLLSKVPIAPANIYRMQGENPDLESAAADYGRLLRDFGPLDLVLLGMGPDGHTASLFPHTPALNETHHRCVATGLALLDPHVPRLTLTFPALNAARHVWILVTGQDKAARLQSVLETPQDIQSQPIQGIAPAAGELAWLLDEGAASGLARR